MSIFFPRSNKFTQFLLDFPNRHRLIATVVLPSSSMEAPPNGYRRNVNIYLINSSKKIFSASRLDIPEAWQMPQGAEYISIATGMVLKNTAVEERLLALKHKNLDFVQADALLLQLRLLMKNVVGSDAMTLVTCIDLKGAGIDPSDPNTILSFDEYNKPLLDFLSSLPHNQKMDEAVISISTVKTDDEITGKRIQKPKFIEAQEFTCVAAADPTCDDSELPPSAAAADPTCVLFSAYQSHPKGALLPVSKILNASDVNSSNTPSLTKDVNSSNKPNHNSYLSYILIIRHNNIDI
ncbi:hypothetical protein SSX86_029961 [Deinandra increscens subsp. villosa]|uniref:Uncharacterized protein n=1 Tax=Deinandra increscens subsp. villosa TaxID=3103831 RepID=A0AAP0CDK6_9ASTR